MTGRAFLNGLRDKAIKFEKGLEKAQRHHDKAYNITSRLSGVKVDNGSDFQARWNTVVEGLDIHKENDDLFKEYLADLEVFRKVCRELSSPYYSLALDGWYVKRFKNKDINPDLLMDALEEFERIYSNGKYS